MNDPGVCPRCHKQMLIEEGLPYCFSCGEDPQKRRKDDPYLIIEKWRREELERLQASHKELKEIADKEVTIVKEVPMTTPEEKAKFEGMNIHEKSKWIKAHLEEIKADMRSMSRRDMFLAWPLGQSALDKIRKTHLPEMVGKPRGQAAVKAKEEIGKEVDKVAELTEHERYLMLLGYQQAVREFLKSIYLKPF